MTRLPTRAAPFRSTLIIGMLAATTALSGCAALLVGGAVVGGSLLATDRRSSGTQLDDQAIEIKANSRIRDLLGDRGHVNATSYNRLLLLTGEVPTDTDRANIEQALARIDNVKSVVNELAVMTASSLSQRSNDALVTTKVKATLVDAGDISANAFKVFTERGIVYLMGRVTEREAERAADLTRSISGVQKVVKVLEIVTDAELAEIDPKAVPKSAAAR
ncbi:BON domain-containing protein [Rhizobacter sp. J219]|jgi:osmotically-inducible protein OsmY|uniref:BON domain-containing protein n=1 Tax=Rhizobacter sp. J219 TaxID=2898430 RepID=UPI002151B831|nr:BON domain-containing protein [Rhizobacter sp. J219]MCR5884363.1 BON domain-containing protein [Rhizobacter sp. J219]